MIRNSRVNALPATIHDTIYIHMIHSIVPNMGRINQMDTTLNKQMVVTVVTIDKNVCPRPQQAPEKASANE